METAQKINGVLLAKMMQTAVETLRTHAKTVNNLNVFPIPDGDTGDNMLLTLIGGAKAAETGNSAIGETARQIADGMLLSARGNSGVILSQIFEGFANGLCNVTEADNAILISALQEGVRHSYHAVMEPTEGTILTVMRRATEHVSATPVSDPCLLFRELHSAASRTLEETPSMLPVLQKAGVVDSGGAGLVYIIEGMLHTLEDPEKSPDFSTPTEPSSQNVDINRFTENSVLEYGYCTELLLRLQCTKTDIETFEVSFLTEYLKGIGDSVVAVKTGSLVKIHIHTMTPDRVLAFCQRYGEFLKVKIENMSLQHNSIPKTSDALTPQKTERKPYGVVAVASGEGISQLFTERGADVIIPGGQTQNPSTEDFIKAFDAVNADTILVFPNNGNILLAARQAAGMYQNATVYVIESHTVGDGYAALSVLSFESGDIRQIISEMNDAMQGVITAEISKSIRNTDEVCAGDYIGISGKTILTDRKTRYDAACATIEHLMSDSCEVCLLLYGKDTDPAEAKALQKDIQNRYPDKEIYLMDGKQEIYDYIIILE